jgi:hypothetical protein
MRLQGSQGLVPSRKAAPPVTGAAIYGGSNVGNIDDVYSEVGNCHGQGQYVSLTLPPLGMLILRPATPKKPAIAGASSTKVLRSR